MGNLPLHIITFIFVFFLSGYSVAQESNSDKAEDNCEVVGINYQDNPEMTRSERLALMEQAFYESLNKFEDCNTAPKSNSSSSSTSSTGNAGAGGASAASESLQGTEPEAMEEPVSSSASAGSEETTGSGATGPHAAATNGRIPEDIPPAENDDAIAAQIRLAAEAESDPETREKLWNEYRKYKEMNVEQ